MKTWSKKVLLSGLMIRICLAVYGFVLEVVNDV